MKILLLSKGKKRDNYGMSKQSLVFKSRTTPKFGRDDSPSCTLFFLLEAW
jgi:hypothetical protein